LVFADLAVAAPDLDQLPAVGSDLIIHKFSYAYLAYRKSNATCLYSIFRRAITIYLHTDLVRIY
jgi:hypothetical protein